MSILIDRINENVKTLNRNYCGLFVGRVGTGKSWSCIRIAEQYDPTFTIKERVVFRIVDLVRKVKNGELKPGSIIIFDEAGIDASNRKSYMNKLNKALAYLMQTWRHRRIVMFITVPDISYIDAGVRKLFDDLFETKEVMKKEGVVRVDAKHIQVNLQTGDTYYKRWRMNHEIILMSIGKPSVKNRHIYEKMKTDFTTKLYEEIEEDLTPKEKPKNQDKDNPRRCPNCGNLGIWRGRLRVYRCRSCDTTWQKDTQVNNC